MLVHGIPFSIIILGGFFISVVLRVASPLFGKGPGRFLRLSYCLYAVMLAVQLFHLGLADAKLHYLSAPYLLGCGLTFAVLASEVAPHAFGLNPSGRSLSAAGSSAAGTIALLVAVMAYHQPRTVPFDPSALARVSVARLLIGRHVTGPANAGRTIIMFGDAQCPYCAEAFKAVYQASLATGGPRFVFYHFPLDSHVGSFRLAVMAESASELGDFWGFESRLYARVGSSPAQILGPGGTTGETSLTQQVTSDWVLGDLIGMTGTPALIEIDGTEAHAIPLALVRYRYPSP